MCIIQRSLNIADPIQSALLFHYIDRLWTPHIVIASQKLKCLVCGSVNTAVRPNQKLPARCDSGIFW